ncbi:hypothetical protein [Arabidopsis thaliana]|uniref:Uncharacterized protein AT4g16050 n=1 Tax=Arabidopsis thaliana TaxID=3702 RepID=O23454_ARATH|nr:hypothetical protein [Arabidopsis thaliana]CAB78647.1 hypothetical protein [Arabidopsis thaliana]
MFPTVSLCFSVLQTTKNFFQLLRIKIRRNQRLQEGTSYGLFGKSGENVHELCGREKKQAYEGDRRQKEMEELMCLWLGMDHNARLEISSEKMDVILKQVVKHFFVKNESLEEKRRRLETLVRVVAKEVINSNQSESAMKNLEEETKKERTNDDKEFALKINEDETKNERTIDAMEFEASIAYVVNDMLGVTDPLLRLERFVLAPLPEMGSPKLLQVSNLRIQHNMEPDEKQLADYGRWALEAALVLRLFNISFLSFNYVIKDYIWWQHLLSKAKKHFFLHFLLLLQMDSTFRDEDLVEEREELMVSYSENNSRPIMKKAHFLKPFVTSSIDGFQALHKPTWLKSGIFEAIKASTYRIHKNPSLILSLAQNWCPETNTFVFPWGEATITLEDVNVLLGFSISGSSVFASLQSSEMKEAVEKLQKRCQGSMKQESWISSFVDDEMEHEAFLVLWLSKFVFPDKFCTRGERIAFAPAVLANLYNDLGHICVLASIQNVLASSLFKLVQVWIWERFKSIRPEAKVIPRGQPRIAQWSGLKQRFKNVGLIIFHGNFDWRPYSEPLENWNPPRFYVEEAKWVRIDESLDGDYDDDDEFVSFARCVRVSKLVGIGVVENYYPNRVAMQFGLAQDVPVLGTNHRRNFTEEEAWDDYNKPLVGLKLYFPSRVATASVTTRYRDWWAKSVSEMRKESMETFNVSSTVDHYDDSDDDIPLKIVPLSQVYQKLDDEMKKAKHSTNKRRKRAREDDESAAETEDDESADTEDDESADTEDDESAETEDDDNMTIAQRINSRKKSDDIENTEGERSRLVADNNVSGLPQKLAYGDETVATTQEETEQKNNENKSSNGVAAEKEEDDERLKQRKLAIKELALKTEARMLKVENTLAKIKQWKLTRLHTKKPLVSS